MHIIANHYEDMTNRSLRKDLRQFFRTSYHFNWIGKVGRKFLNERYLSADEFCSLMLTHGEPISELGILVIARMYRIHIAVIMRDWMWTTGRNLELSECKIVLGFAGRNEFFDTYKFVPDTDSDRDSDIEVLSQRQPIDLSINENGEFIDNRHHDLSMNMEVDNDNPGLCQIFNQYQEDTQDSTENEIDLKETPAMPTPPRSPIPGPSTPSAPSEEQTPIQQATPPRSPPSKEVPRPSTPASTSKEQTPPPSPGNSANADDLETPQSKELSRPSTPAAASEEQTPPPSPGNSANADDLETPQSKELPRPSTPAATSEEQTPPPSPGNSEHTESNANMEVSRPSTPAHLTVEELAKKLPRLSVSLEKLTWPKSAPSVENTKRHAAPTNLTEADPIGSHLSDASPLPSEYETDKTEDYSSDEEIVKKPDKTIQTEGGALGISFYGIRKKKKVMKSVKCPVCTEDFRSTSQHNKHMKKKHPNFMYHCSECEREFHTFNACYKHTQKHYKLKYGCDSCEQRFQFPYQLKYHLRVHRENEKVQCTWKGCFKKFTCNKNMFQHLQAHTDETFECKECEPMCTFQTKTYLRQHQKGFHGPGFIALCGKSYRWPNKRKAHQEECLKCDAIRKEKQNKPQNPRHFKKKEVWKP